MWFLALLKRFLRLDLFPSSSYLHWVNFAHQTEALTKLANLVMGQQIKVHVGEVYPLSEDGLYEALRDQLSRRAVGKIVLNP